MRTVVAVVVAATIFAVVCGQSSSSPSSSYASSAGVVGGMCGDNVKWSYDEKTETLTIELDTDIEGDGKMYDFSAYDDMPWYDYYGDVGTLVIKEGVTHIGNHSFHYHYPFSEISLPSSLKSIGAYAFGNCYNIRNVTLPDGVTKVGLRAFAENSYNSLYIPSSVRTIEEKAFFYNYDLKNVTISEGVETIGDFAFAEIGANTIVVPGSVRSIGAQAFSSYCLKEFIFLGTEDVSLDNLFYDHGSLLTSVCVPPDYNSDYLSEAVITRNTSICETFESAFNHCYEAKYIDGEFKQLVRKNATDYENLSNECMEYRCSNDTGRVPRSLCHRTKTSNNMCLEQKCVRSDSFVKKWSVVVEFNEHQVKAEEVDVINVTAEISNMTGIAMEVILVGAEFDDEGYAISVIAYVEDEEMAIKIRDELNAMDKGEGCPYDVLCRTKPATIRVSELDMSPSLSIHTTMMAFLIILGIVLGLH